MKSNKTVKITLLTTLVLLLSLSPITLFASNWTNKSEGLFGFNQTTLDNWTSGGDSSWSLLFEGKNTVSKEFGLGKFTNRIKLSYGISKTGSLETRKSADELKLDSKFRSKKTLMGLPYIAEFSVLTQLAEGKDYSASPATAVSYFFDPAYLTFSLGLSKIISPVLSLSGGAAMKSTIVSKTTIVKAKSEAGFNFSADYEENVMEWLTLSSLLQLFSPAENLKNTDVYWDTNVAVPLRENLQLGYHINLIFDKDVSVKRQIKSSLVLQLVFSV